MPGSDLTLLVLKDEGQCVRSGYCCMQAPCPYGDWSEDGDRCRHLLGEEPGEHACAIVDEIRKDPWSYASPAFGAGCCSPLFNERRAAVFDRGVSS